MMLLPQGAQRPLEEALLARSKVSVRLDRDLPLDARIDRVF
jgi:hypothetical protein